MELQEMRKATKAEEAARAALARAEADQDGVLAQYGKARDDLAAARTALVEADAAYTVAVRQRFDGQITPEAEEKSRRARQAVAEQIDRLERLIPGLDERSEAKREAVAEARQKYAEEVCAASQAALDEVARQIIELCIPLNILHEKAMGLCGETEQACKRLGMSVIPIKFRLIELAEERSRQDGQPIRIR